MSEEEQIDGAPPNHRSTQGADVDMDVDSYADSDYNSNDSDSDLDGNTTVAIYDIIWSVRHDDKFGNLARGDFEERLKIRRVSNGGADGTHDTYHTFSFRHGKYLVKGYCDLSDGSIPVHGPFGNFSMQWMNGAMVTDFVEGDWEADDQGNGYFHLGFMNNLVDDHGAAILAFRFLLGQAGESKPNTQVYGWAKLRTELDGCPPADISEAEKQRLDGNDSGDMEPDLLGRLRSLFSAADQGCGLQLETIAIYDILFDVGSGSSGQRSYGGDNITIKRIEIEDFDFPDPPLTEEEEEYRYKAYFHYSSFDGVFTCKAFADEKTFSDFKVCRKNRSMKESILGEYDTQFRFEDGVVDDAGNPFMWFFMAFDGKLDGVEICGRAKLRDGTDSEEETETALTEGERKMLDDCELSFDDK
ncbi:hypothetical protein DL95DRAFT_460982 [Leptodontidium sp. 2 PMI_412]|nr:hypothetical protein DL95DRAFT_460982 [Leptodontidium sp. 2 PMI_412]